MPPQTLPTLGRRGGGWVVAQVVLIAAIALSALAGAGWPASLAVPAAAVGSASMAVGAAMLVAGGGRLGAALTPYPAPLPGHELRTTGIYRLVRHPMYGGGILLSAGWSIVFATLPGIALTVVLGLLAELKSRREELWLEERHPGYRAYRARTRHRFVPWLW